VTGDVGDRGPNGAEGAEVSGWAASASPRGSGASSTVRPEGRQIITLPVVTATAVTVSTNQTGASRHDRDEAGCDAAMPCVSMPCMSRSDA
jgi:hypothetical protein